MEERDQSSEARYPLESFLSKYRDRALRHPLGRTPTQSPCGCEDRAIQASPQSLDPHIHMETVLGFSLKGDATHDRDIYSEMIQVDTELLTIDPFLPFVRRNLAGALYNLGQVDRAMLEVK